MDVIEVLLQSQSLLFVLKIVLGDSLLKVLIGIAHLIQLHLKLDNLFDSIGQIFLSLSSFLVKFCILQGYGLFNLFIDNVLDVGSRL